MPRCSFQQSIDRLSLSGTVVVILVLLYLGSSRQRWGLVVSKRDFVKEQNGQSAPRNDGTAQINDWSIIKERLCPSGVPNTTMGEVLFSMANKAMAPPDLPTSNHTRPVSNLDMIERFYDGFFDDKEAMSIYRDQNQTFAYVRIYKCGNNFVRGWQRAAFRHNLHEGAEFLPGASPIDATNIIKSTSDVHQCIVTVIRDPIAHFLSAYNEIEYRIWSKINKPKDRRPPTFLELPFETEGQREQRFRQFIVDVLTNKWGRFKGIGPLHFTSMSRILSAMDKKGLSLTNYLPSTHNLSSTWPSFLKSACPEMLQVVPQRMSEEAVGQHESSSDEVGFYEAAKSVWNRSGAASRALCILHAVDYACWDDLPEGIPTFCAEVYGELPFHDAIVG